MESRKPATYEDLFDVPDHLVGEILNGELHVSPRPARPHAVATSVLGMQIGSAFHLGRGGPGGWTILDEPELHLSANILVPDLAGWRSARLDDAEQTFFRTRPDWICEVLSPSTERIDRLVKMDLYAGAGVPWAWLVQPVQRFIEVYELVDGVWLRRRVVDEDPEALLPPFEAVPFDVSALWG